MACADDVRARAKATAINLIISLLLGFDSDRKAKSRSLRAIHSTASRPVDPPQLHRLFGSRAACSDAMSKTILHAEGCTRPGALPEKPPSRHHRRSTLCRVPSGLYRKMAQGIPLKLNAAASAKLAQIFREPDFTQWISIFRGPGAHFGVFHDRFMK